MPYSSFTLESLILRFDLKIQESTLFREAFQPVPVSDLLRQVLGENVAMTRDIGTEKARSEFIIAPVLSEVRRQLNQRISVFSGVEFNVDESQGLNGVCDFLLSLSPLQLAIQAPVISIVEAKNENIKAGFAQCVAELLGAERFNQQRGYVLPYVYGVVTTGTLWRFLQVRGQLVEIDTDEVSIERIEQIVGVLVGMIQASEGSLHHSHPTQPAPSVTHLA